MLQPECTHYYEQEQSVTPPSTDIESELIAGHLLDPASKTFYHFCSDQVTINHDKHKETREQALRPQFCKLLNLLENSLTEFPIIDNWTVTPCYSGDWYPITENKHHTEQDTALDISCENIRMTGALDVGTHVKIMILYMTDTFAISSDGQIYRLGNTADDSVE